MRIGVVGKTGTGKTTVAALLALAYAEQGRRVLAVDTDTNPNLGLSLGLGSIALGTVRAVPRALTTGRGTGGVSSAQLLEGYGIGAPSGVTLLHAMAASETAAGCACPCHSSLHSPLAIALDDAADVAVVDLEEGLDHLSRTAGTLAHLDHLLVVMGPTRKSLLSAQRLVSQARQWGIARVSAVANLAGSDDAELMAASAAECQVDLAGIVPASPSITDADRAGAGLELRADGLHAALGVIINSLRSRKPGDASAGTTP